MESARSTLVNRSSYHSSALFERHGGYLRNTTQSQQKPSHLLNSLLLPKLISNSSLSLNDTQIGRLSAPGVISCKPPRLAESGDYEVTVSLDGNTTLHLVVQHNSAISRIKTQILLHDD